MRRLRFALGLLAAAAPAAASDRWPDPASLAPSSSGAPATLRIAVEHPAEGARFAGERPIYLAGQALPPGVAQPRRDIVVAIDASQSTLDALGEPGAVPVPVAGARADSAPPGSVLEAEIAAARKLLRTLDPRVTRVAVVSFAGDAEWTQSVPPEWSARNPAARTWIALSSDWDAVSRALDALAAAGGHGLTHMAAGVERATSELVGGPGASSEVDPRAHRAILFMSDGVPTLPAPRDPWRNAAELFVQVRRASSYGIRIHSFALGQQALRGPFTVAQMASETGGVFTAVADPATLPERLPRVPLAGLESLSVRNLTTGEDALATQLRVDGSFDALVALAPGANRVEIRAQASDGSAGRRELVLERDDASAAAAAAGPAGAGAPSALPDHLAERRRELYEDALEERREAYRKALVEEMESSRAAAAAQRKQLELRLEKQGPVGAPPPP